MGSGGVAIAALPTVICLKVPFSDGLGGVHLSPLGFAACQSKKCTNRARTDCLLGRFNNGLNGLNGFDGCVKIRLIRLIRC